MDFAASARLTSRFAEIPRQSSVRWQTHTNKATKEGSGVATVDWQDSRQTSQGGRLRHLKQSQIGAFDIEVELNVASEANLGIRSS